MDRLTRDYLRSQEKLREDLSIAVNKNIGFGKSINANFNPFDSGKEDKVLKLSNSFTARIIKIVLMMITSIFGLLLGATVFLNYFDSPLMTLFFVIWWFFIVWKS